MTEEEIASATWSILSASVEMKVFVSKANFRGQKMVALKIGAKDAAKLSLEGHLKISWLRCRMREKLVTPRYFKSLDSGHVAKPCKGPDRNNLSLKCGSPDHKASACTSTESCVLCAEAGLKNNLVRHGAG